MNEQTARASRPHVEETSKSRTMRAADGTTVSLNKDPSSGLLALCLSRNDEGPRLTAWLKPDERRQLAKALHELR